MVIIMVIIGLMSLVKSVPQAVVLTVSDSSAILGDDP